MSVLVWADVPVVDLSRAIAFYAHVLGVPVVSPPGMEGRVALVMGDPPSVDLALSTDVRRDA